MRWYVTPSTCESAAVVRPLRSPLKSRKGLDAEEEV